VIDAGRSPAERTLLFIHGFGGYAMQWEQQLIAFADKNPRRGARFARTWLVGLPDDGLHDGRSRRVMWHAW
jgi:pimeloyl-ACP methyl ester carboxylesterase